jgi:cation transport regulator ChaC
MLTTIFGYGSLINTQSLKASVPNPGSIRPSYIKGFLRSFNLWDEVGFTVGNKDIAGIPYCALDVMKVDDINKRVNGVSFTVNDKQLINLLEREHDYSLIKTTVYDFETDNEIGECVLFVANKNNGTFAYNSESQKRYLGICLSGAKEFGHKFYDNFLESTFIKNKALKDMPGLVSVSDTELDLV